ncbi:N-6 DNA methylase [Actinopolyspora sp. H202]|uniref:N-6 DNA methylase n=1 Tax=Actinopolyspora sp. H202 TaxID=1500456 RepID=UPI003F4A01B0
MRSIRGLIEPRHYRVPLLTLVYLRSNAPEKWKELRSSAGQHDRDGIAAALQRVNTTLHWLPNHYGTPGSETLEALVEFARELDQEFPVDRFATNSPALSELFDYLVETLFAYNRDGVEYYTPWSVARTMIGIIRPSSAEKVHDPCCGVGNLLIETSRFRRERDCSVPASHLSARALTEESLIVASMRAEFEGAAMEIGAEPENVLLRDSRAYESFDVILSNPPFGKGIQFDTSHKDDTRWRYGTPMGGDPSFAWLQHAVDKLVPGGRAAVLMGEQAGFSGGANGRIRAAMLNDGVVESVITLPRGLFHATGISVSVWILRKRTVGESTRDEVLLIDASEMGRLVERNRRELSHEEIERIANAYRDFRTGRTAAEEGFLRAVPLEEIRERDHRLTPRGYLTGASEETDPVTIVREARQSDARMLEVDEQARHEDSVVEYALLDSGLRSENLPIESGWGETTLGEVCEALAGPGGQLRKLEYHSEGIALVAPKNIHNNRIIDEGMNRIAPEQITGKLERYRLAAGDVLCVRTGSPGRPALVDPSHGGALFGTACIRLRPDTSLVTGQFLTYWLGTPQAREWISRNSSSGTIPSLNARALRALPVRLPPLSVQRDIGRVFGTLDDKIAAHDNVVRATAELRESLGSMLGNGMFSTSDGSD